MSAVCVGRHGRYNGLMAHISAAERRPQLIKAAIDLMTRKGVGAASTRAVAAELGVAQMTVHYVFGSKQELYRAVLEQLSQEVLDGVRKAPASDARFEDAMATMARALWRSVREDPLTHLVVTELSILALRDPNLRETITGHFYGMGQAASVLIAQTAERTGQPLAQSPDTVARFFLAGFDGLTMQRLSIPDDEAEEACLNHLIASTVALATEGAAPLPSLTGSRSSAETSTRQGGSTKRSRTPGSAASTASPPSTPRT